LTRTLHAGTGACEAAEFLNELALIGFRCLNFTQCHIAAAVCVAFAALWIPCPVQRVLQHGKVDDTYELQQGADILVMRAQEIVGNAGRNIAETFSGPTPTVEVQCLHFTEETGRVNV
jgi:hypothetical protein